MSILPCNDWPNDGRTSVAHMMVANTRMAKHRFASSPSTNCTFKIVTKHARAMRKDIYFDFTLNGPKGVGRMKSGGAFSVPPVMMRLLTCPSFSPRRSCPIICRQTVSRSQTICKEGGEVKTQETDERWRRNLPVLADTSLAQQ